MSAAKKSRGSSSDATDPDDMKPSSEELQSSTASSEGEGPSASSIELIESRGVDHDAEAFIARLNSLPGRSSPEVENIRREFAEAFTPMIAWSRARERQLDFERGEFHNREGELRQREAHLAGVLRTERELHKQIVDDYEARCDGLKAREAHATEIKEAEITQLREKVAQLQKAINATSRIMEAKEGRIQEIKLQLDRRAEIGGDFNVDAPAIRQYKLKIEAELRAEEGKKRKRALSELEEAHLLERRKAQAKHLQLQSVIDQYAAGQRARQEENERLPRCSTCERRIQRPEEVFTCLADECMATQEGESSRRGVIVIDLASEPAVQSPTPWPSLRKFCPLCILRSHRRHHSTPMESLASKEAVADAVQAISTIREEINGPLLEKFAAYRELLNETLPEKNGLIDQSLACLSTGRPLLQSFVERETAKVADMRDAFATYINGEFSTIIERLKAEIRGKCAWMPSSSSSSARGNRHQ